MCVVCNVVEKDYVEAALAVESIVTGETMTIPVTMAINNFHSFEFIQSMLINANLIALIF
jgi:hypothetical protein